MIDTSKIIHAPINGSRYTETAPLWKEHYGIYLKIEGADLPETYEVDFSNDELHGTSVTMIGNADGVLIPHQFIDTGKDVFAFLYWVGEDFGKTVYKFKIPNRFRPDRTNEQPTPEEQSVIDQAIAALNDAVEQTAQDVIDSDASARMALGYAESAQESARQAQEYSTVAISNANSASQSASQASASATASAQSAEQSAINSADAQDSAKEAQGYASASANSASQASASATSASQNATSAQGYASQAQTSAQTASSKASEASGYASTASTKASESAQSASQALTYKTDAESAKTASQTAQGKAEDAQTAAETAQGKAEDAQEAAESAAASVSASAAQIAQNEADILKAFPTDSASGSIASFSDGADDIPLKSLIVNIDPVQDLSNGDPSPENICPISGWEGMEIQHTGKNLCSVDTYTIPLNAKRNEIWSGNLTGTFTVTIDKSGITSVEIPTSSRFCGVMVDGNTVWIPYTQDSMTVTGNITQIVVYGSDAYAKAVGTIKVQLEVGDSATEYEPYQGRTINVNWQTEAGTVYGGKLDVLSGMLTIDMAMVTFDGHNTDFGVTVLTTFSQVAWVGYNNIGIANDSFVCDRLKTVSNNNRALNTIYPSAVPRMFMGLPVTITNATEANAWFAENPTHVVYHIANPITIQFSPNEVNSLLGVNNIWADTGDCAVEYRADTRLYIEKLTQPEEDDMIADSAITSGQFFMIRNSLYRALANIASGATITVGTNAQRVSLSDALNIVNA